MASANLTESTAPGPSPRPQRPRRARWRNPLADHPPSSELAFPGCKPVHLPREALETWDGRLEFWDRATETAWVCEPSSPRREKPGGALPSLVERIAQMRGSPMTCYGSMDLGARRVGRCAAHPAGGPVGVPASPTGAAAGGGGDGGGQARPAGRGAGGGPHDERVPGEAPAVRGVEVSPGFLADPVFAESSVDAVFEAASACKDEAGFLAVLRPPQIADGAGGTN